MASSPSLTPSAPASALRTQLHRDGFVVIRKILHPAELEPLRAAAVRTTALARAGNWPYIRTVGKQFPPWPSKPDPAAGGIWGVQHLLHPDLPDSQVFAQSYFGDAVLDMVKALLSSSASEGGWGECRDDDLVMELYNMLVRPDAPFELRWHRDDVPWTATAEEELARLEAAEHAHAQWNLALCDGDASLVVVRGSHRRARTEAERAAEPYQAILDEQNGDDQITVRLDAGDAVFYDNNIVHRGVYDCAQERLSLHGTVGHRTGSAARARNVLQHGVGAWVDQCDFAGGLGGDDRIRERAEGMRERLVQLGRASGDVGFSLEG
ncbi:phytanoyl-CoA dioxygenase [Apiospora rasikravindrae]|uniref:Phytanoyl-CoA dioxygenase n=1 Tax=Apiospora rasikravindrae TaxID=990691 RepID=A0ABR1SJZ8_9PEZI